MPSIREIITSWSTSFDIYEITLAVIVVSLIAVPVSLRFSDKTLQEITTQVRSFFDIYDLIFGVASVLVVALILLLQASLSVAVAIFTAVYALISIKRVRGSESARVHSATVRRDFHSKSDSDRHEFGLRNFGSGPALYLRVYATVEPNGPDLTIQESDPPLHLEEGEFLSLLQGELTELRNEDSDLYASGDAERIDLYYTFDSLSGRPTPPDLKNPREMSVEELVEKARNPRTEKLENLRKNCAKPSEVVEESSL